MAGNTNNEGKGPKYFINIDGKEYPWDKPTITVVEIRELAGWGADQAVEEINIKDSSKATLSNDSSIELKPGHGFSKKVEFEPASVKPVGAHGHGK